MKTMSNKRPLSEAEPLTGQRGKITQPFGTLARYPLGLSGDARAASVEALNQVLADTASLRDMYKKHHWQVSGPHFTRCIYYSTSTPRSRPTS